MRSRRHSDTAVGSASRIAIAGEIEGRGRAEASLRDRGGVATGRPDTRIEPDSEALARAVLEGRVGLVLLDAGGRVLNANRAAGELLGSAHELIGRTLEGIVNPDDRGWSKPELELLAAGAVDRVRQQLRLVAVDGGERWIELTVHRAGESAGGACMVAILEQIGDRGLHARELERLAYTDPLTGCWNRRRFASELDRHLSLSARYGPRGTLLMIDIDGLKQINDTHGHQAGDDAIVATAELLRGNLRASDIIGRIGGDEFAVLLPAAGCAQAAAVATALLAAASTGPHRGRQGSLSLSIGIADILARPSDPATLFARADRSMYEAKRSGGNAYAIDRPRETRPEPEPGRDVAAATGNPRPHAVSLVADGSEQPIDIEALLATVAELGAPSLALVALELCASEQDVAGAWTTATRTGLLERIRYDPVNRDWQYGLSDRGRRRLNAREHDGAGGDHRPPAAEASDRWPEYDPQT